MLKRFLPLMVMFALFSLSFLGLTLLRVADVIAKAAPPQQYPMMDKVADKVIMKYTQSSCEQLWVKKAEKAPPTAEEQKAVAFLKSDPQMRAAFINRIAPPIANKMFDCGMIP
jgi:Na+-translocating ferredoxin:NAD+ oxidoreductase RnfG subunit